MSITSKLIEMGCFVKKTGSQAICNPPPENSDIDYLVSCKDDVMLNNVVSELEYLGYECESEEYEDQLGAFYSYRKGKINLIVTCNKTFAKRHSIATDVCKKLNLLKKEDRIMVFKAFLYNEKPQ